MATEPPKAVYANVLNVTAGAFDVVLDFGFQPPESMQRKSPDYEIVARVAMSLAHAKTMLPILARIIAEYEEKVGPITAPGFEQFGKE
jgi:Protein of unknown function (DUF3467)